MLVAFVTGGLYIANLHPKEYLAGTLIKKQHLLVVTIR